MAEPGTAYLLGCEDSVPRGFAILRGLDDPHGNVLLKRIVVEAAGRGSARAFWTPSRPGSSPRRRHTGCGSTCSRTIGGRALFSPPPAFPRAGGLARALPARAEAGRPQSPSRAFGPEGERGGVRPRG